jgi:RNA polymerase sigma-70 factor (ECF subfamily)
MDESTQNLAFETVARELSPALTRYLRHYVSDSTVADDLLQETLVRISHGLGNFEQRSSIKTWAFAIATRVAADYFRQPEHRVKIVDILDFEDSEELADDESAIDEKLANGAMNACIREVIDSLPEDYRAALVLHDLEEISARQIAEICDIPISTVKIRIHRGRKRLREALKTQCEFYRDNSSVFRCYRKTELLADTDPSAKA